jgi:hypothetical protein
MAAFPAILLEGDVRATRRRAGETLLNVTVPAKPTVD